MEYSVLKKIEQVSSHGKTQRNHSGKKYSEKTKSFIDPTNAMGKGKTVVTGKEIRACRGLSARWVWTGERRGALRAVKPPCVIPNGNHVV